MQVRAKGCRKRSGRSSRSRASWAWIDAMTTRAALRATRIASAILATSSGRARGTTSVAAPGVIRTSQNCMLPGAWRLSWSAFISANSFTPPQLVDAGLHFLEARAEVALELERVVDLQRVDAGLPFTHGWAGPAAKQSGSVQAQLTSATRPA